MKAHKEELSYRAGTYFEYCDRSLSLSTTSSLAEVNLWLSKLTPQIYEWQAKQVKKTVTPNEDIETEPFFYLCQVVNNDVFLCPDSSLDGPTIDNSLRTRQDARLILGMVFLYGTGFSNGHF